MLFWERQTSGSGSIGASHIPSQSPKDSIIRKNVGQKERFISLFPSSQPTVLPFYISAVNARCRWFSNWKSFNVQNYLNNSHTYKIPINFLQNCTYEKPISKIIISNSTRSPPENTIEIGFECHRIIFCFDDFTVCSIFASPTDMCEGSKNCYHKIQISKSNQINNRLFCFNHLLPLSGV